MTEQRTTLLGVGVCEGLEAEYVPRSQTVYVRDPREGEGASVRVSVARWTRFLASVKANAFVPQQESDVVTLAIGDLSHIGVMQYPSFLAIDRPTWDIFVKAVKSGAFDHLTD